MGKVARAVRPTGGSWPVRFGTAELLQDLDRPDAWLLLVDGTPQSHVDLGDPTHLDFDYVRRIADLVDARPPGPVTALHLGGGGCTIPRYVSATRPGSTQVVVEADDLLVEVVRAQLGTDGFRLRVGEGREALHHLTAATADLLVADVFVGALVPSHLATCEAVAEAARLLRPGGCYVVNVGDRGRLPFARSLAAALRASFPYVVALADPAVLRGRRFGNVVLAGSDEPFDLDGLRRVAARSLAPTRVEDGADFARAAVAPTDAAPAAVPVPPQDLFDRR